MFFLLTRPLLGDPISYSKLPDLDNIVNSVNYVTSPISLIHNSSFDTDFSLRYQVFAVLQYSFTPDALYLWQTQRLQNLGIKIFLRSMPLDMM